MSKPALLWVLVSLGPATCADAAPDDLERGAYLVKITGCAGCHSPRNKDGDLIDELLFSGGNRAHAMGDIGRIYPPNITPDAETGIGHWSAQDIATAIKTGRAPDGRILSAAMPWRTQSKDLTDEDALAIGTYLKSIAPLRHQVPAPLPPEK